jgi:pimeloyl-ACP methyl ester carboxylesterase
VRWLRNFIVILIGGLAALAVVGAVYQVFASAADQRTFLPPGKLVDVGGLRLHLYCTGELQPGQPTVILEALSGGMSSYWVWVQGYLAETTRVCSYDRPGRAWSDPAPSPPTLAGTLQNLHALLQGGGVSAPYVLVGHSIGGLFVRAYTAAYPHEVSGLVLLDSAHPHQFERYPELRAQNDSYARMQAFFPALARIGLFHIYFAAGGEIDFQDLPELQHDQVAAEWSSPEYFETMQEKLAASQQIYADAQTLGALGDLPLAVITAGAGSTDGWLEMQTELARLSTNSVHTTIPDANHASLVFNPDHARQVAEIVLDVVSSASVK